MSPSPALLSNASAVFRPINHVSQHKERYSIPELAEWLQDEAKELFAIYYRVRAPAQVVLHLPVSLTGDTTREARGVAGRQAPTRCASMELQRDAASFPSLLTVRQRWGTDLTLNTSPQGQ